MTKEQEYIRDYVIALSCCLQRQKMSSSFGAELQEFHRKKRSSEEGSLEIAEYLDNEKRILACLRAQFDLENDKEKIQMRKVELLQTLFLMRMMRFVFLETFGIICSEECDPTAVLEAVINGGHVSTWQFHLEPLTGSDLN